MQTSFRSNSQREIHWQVGSALNSPISLRISIRRADQGDLKHRVRRLRAQNGRRGNISGSVLEKGAAVHEASGT